MSESETQKPGELPESATSSTDSAASACGNVSPPATTAEAAGLHQPSPGVSRTARVADNLPVARRRRLLRIQFGRALHWVALSARAGGLKNVVAAAWTGLDRGWRYCRTHRRGTALGGVVLAGGMMLAMMDRREEQPSRTTEPTPIVLDDVKVFPMDGGSEFRKSGEFVKTGFDNVALRKSASADGTPAGAFGRGPDFPATSSSRQIDATPMPTTPRAAWLTGAIEEVDPAPSGVRPAGYVELPITPQTASPFAAPRILHRDRRDRAAFRR